MKRMVNSLMLVVIVSVFFVSCNEQKKELKELIEKFNNACPIPLGDIGSINSVSLNGETVEMKFTSNETYAPISSLSGHPQELKDILAMNLSMDSSRKLVDLIISANCSFKTIFVGNQSGQRTELSLSASELGTAIEKFSNMNDKQKLVASMVMGSKIKLPLAIDNTMKLVGLSLTSDALVYKYEIKDTETGQNINSAKNIMKYMVLSQMANSMKGGMIGERNRQFYQALVDCKQGLEYEYHELNTGNNMTFRISTDEMKEVLNGKWDNQPTAEEWENLGNALEGLSSADISQDYGSSDEIISPSNNEGAQLYLGKIGNIDVTMVVNLYTNENDVAGYYIYNNSKEKTKFDLVVVGQSGNRLILNEYRPDGFNTGTFDGYIQENGARYVGSFTNSEGRVFSFSVHRK